MPNEEMSTTGGANDEEWLGGRDAKSWDSNNGRMLTTEGHQGWMSKIGGTNTGMLPKREMTTKGGCKHVVSNT